MKNREKIKEMFLLQQRLNDETNGIGWEEGYTQNKKLISWRRCIYMECAELIDSFAWKHWKNINAPTNKENVAIEIADIWHFLMSYILEISYKQKSIDEISDEIINVSGFADFCGMAYNIGAYNIYEIINDIELIIRQTSGFEIDPYELLRNYFRLSLKCGVNLEKLFGIYTGKNVLNKFRQNNGYKDGSYQKIWNGLEDNEVLANILKEGIVGLDEIYNKLEEEYNKIK